MAITRRVLSGSTHGQPINLGISQTGVEVHANTAGSTTLDEVFLWAQNRSSASMAVVGFTFGISGTGNEVRVSVPPNGAAILIPGWTLLGESGGTSIACVRAFNVSGCANVFGYINRIT